MCVFVAVLAVPANTVTEEVVGEEPQAPPTRKRKLEVTNHSEVAETVRVSILLSLLLLLLLRVLMLLLSSRSLSNASCRRRTGKRRSTGSSC